MEQYNTATVESFGATIVFELFIHKTETNLVEIYLHVCFSLIMNIIL